MDQGTEEETGLPDEGMLLVGAATPINPESARFPCCLVWTPLPVISWLAPYIGHVGICREDGVILDFAGAHFVNVDNFAFGAPARYVHLDVKKCCFPSNIGSHACRNHISHAQFGIAASWDNAIDSSMEGFQHKSYNLFTCNCHSFVANCMNKLAYEGSVKWNILKVVVFILSKGQWVDAAAAIRSFAPSVIVMLIGVIMAGWSFFVGWAAFSFLLLAWFTVGTYMFRGLIDC